MVTTKFYDLSTDRLEKRHLSKNEREGKAASAYEKLNMALSGYKGIRTITTTKLLSETKGKKDKKKKN